MPAPTTTILILASPFAGMTQSRFGGCDLSPLWEGTPVWPQASQAAIGSQANSGHCGRGRIPAMPDNDSPPPSQSFFLIVADYDRGFFTVEGPMTDDRPWNDLARHVRDHRQFHVVCGPTGPDRDARRRVP